MCAVKVAAAKVKAVTVVTVAVANAAVAVAAVAVMATVHPVIVIAPRAMATAHREVTAHPA